MKKQILSIIIIFLVTSSCILGKKNTFLKIPDIVYPIEKKLLTKKSMKNWHYKDIEKDTIPGISLERAYATVLKNKKTKKVIVAILDSEIDINKWSNSIWINAKEIANNNIDDDKNGYIDDINGWNFLGNNKGENILNANYEYVRIVRKYQNLFKNKKEIQIKKEDLPDFRKYIGAKTKLDSEFSKMKRRLKYGEIIFQNFLNAKEALKNYFPEEIYTYEKLKEIDTLGNDLGKHVIEIKLLLDYNDTEANMKRVRDDTKNDVNYRLNLDYNSRLILADNPDNINDKNYGNNKLSENLDKYTHGTRMASVVLDKLKNETNEIIVMPIIIEPLGDAHDKDIALGIKYAVDNGAKVINMSFGKEFSMYPEWVHKAFKYAEKHNVLIVSSCGNDGKKLDNDFQKYPNDNIFKGKKEVSDNFLFVGASTINLNKELKASYSNYSNKYVDIFAPGDKIYTTFPNGGKKIDRGTSISTALTSRVAALLFSYYPNLTASQVKHILMDSGLEYDIEVSTPTKDDKNKMTAFNQLSKSGKVLNAYNAFIMADSISRSN